MESLRVAAPVTFTARALEAVRRIRAEESVPEVDFLRVGVKGGGCSGMTYVLGFDARADADELFVIDGIEMVMDKRHALYLHDMQVDYHDGLNARGFVFNNPNATSTCGCGTSFSA